MARWQGAAAFSILVCAQAHAGSVEQELSKLDPEERSHQACIIKGMADVRRDARLAGADRMKSGALAPAKLVGTSLTATGSAVRVKQRWYAMSFTCALTPDFMKATAFTYTLGGEIPKHKWDDLGLW